MSKSTPAHEPLAIVGLDCCLPGAESVAAFEQLIFAGGSGYGEMPPDRYDRDLYFDARRGQPGKAYTTLGGCVTEREPDLDLLGLDAATASLFDPVHLRFCETAVRAWRASGLKSPIRAGVYVGHSGATKYGGAITLSTLIDEALDLLRRTPGYSALPERLQQQTREAVAARMRQNRPRREPGRLPDYHGNTAAALAARVLRLQGPRIVVDAACASSLFALQQAQLAIAAGRIDAALVGGATTNGVDNLILFSQSQACSDQGSRPFDEGASGLISSEGYAAIVVLPLSRAEELQLQIHGVVAGLGSASDGRGKSLWAPRKEGQQLAIRRAYPDARPLSIDYLEAHATSTQLGDATELEAVTQVLQSAGASSGEPLWIGSVKSNFGHTLETAGLVGLIKVLLSMRRGEIPPSLHFERPNQRFNWSGAPLRVVHQKKPWPRRADTRAAAVSAFGIGGLNAHLMVRQTATPGSSAGRLPDCDRAQVRDREPIAIVGRGLVLPGAGNVAAFAESLASGRTEIGSPPPERWSGQTGVQPGAAPGSFRTPTAEGGWIRDYKFDGQSYRIPPKQVQQANPLQMMLLDAVTQAVQELDGGRWGVDRESTGVVIGTIFGGDFSNQLQLGLRLPELARDLIEELTGRGVPAAEAERVAEEFRSRWLRERPALLDETGSFTASTLASRVAKTFDLMGGACAIDVDAASGLAALGLACDQLRHGHWSTAICGGAQRSMDLTAFEELDLRGHLTRSGRPEDIPDNGATTLPGEGVVVLILRRLSDALADGQPIWGIIDHVEVTEASPATAPFAEEDISLMRRIGYLAGVQGLARIVKHSITETRAHGPEDSQRLQKLEIATRTRDGQCYRAACRWGQAANWTNVLDTSRRVAAPRAGAAPVAVHGAAGLSAASAPAQPAFRNAVTSMNSVELNSSSPRLWRFSAETPDELAELLQRTAQSRDADVSAEGFTGRYRCAIVAESQDVLAARLQGVLRAWGKGKRRGVLETERALLWDSGGPANRTAWLFPGQGSQYPGRPDALQHSPRVQQRLDELDGCLKQLRLSPLGPVVRGERAASADDIWWNQIWVLGLSLSLTAELEALGLRPDVVLGHSFGEYGAMLAADVLSLEQGVRMVQRRADAVTLTVRDRGRLISVRSAPAALEAVIREQRLPAEITHYNAPLQTVIAVDEEAVDSVREKLMQAELASVVVPVPVAYHTRRLAEAEQLLRQSFAREAVRAPRCPVLSTTTVRYLAEPEDLRASLIAQLTRPVLYVPCLERLLEEGVGLLLEVGPNNILTRLNHEIVRDRALCLSWDTPGRSHLERRLMLQAATEMLSAAGRTAPLVLPTPQTDLGAATSTGSTPRPAAPPVSAEAVDVEIIDLRQRNRKSPIASASASTAPAAPMAATPYANGAATRPRVAPAAPPAHANGSAAAPTADSSALRHFLKNLVVELTGYEPDVVDFDAELEADLGIDSIKKAQIVGELAETFGLQRTLTDLRLDDFKTLEQIASLAAETAAASGGSAPHAPSANDFAVAGTTPSIAPDSDSIRRFLLDVVVELTGYAPEVVDFDAELEADLGIDSIKKAQIVGELAETFSLSAQPAGMSLDQLRTLSQIAELGVSQLNQDAQTHPVAGADWRSEPAVASFEPTSERRLDPEAIQRFLVDLVVEQTGYSPDVVDLDAELEADLGIDSIKQAQLLGEVQQQFDLQSLSAERSTLSSFPTLRSIVHFLIETLSASEVSAEADRAAAIEPKRPGDAGSALLEKKTRGHAPVDEIPDEWLRDFTNGTLDANGVAGSHGRPPALAQREEVRAALRLMIDRGESAPLAGQGPIREDLKALAVEVGVTPGALQRLATSAAGRRRVSTTAPSSGSPGASGTAVDYQSAPEMHPTRSLRFLLRMMPAPQRDGMPTTPKLTGPALVLGDNPLAQALATRIRALGQECHLLGPVADQAELEAKLDALWARQLTPHLFLTTPHDAAARGPLAIERWGERRWTALHMPYRVCQLWMQRMIDAEAMDGGSVVALTSLGGDFGFSGRGVESPEGGLGGLVKAMLIESWMRGFRSTPMKIIDVAPGSATDDIIDGVWRELAVPSYDTEVALRGRERFVIEPVHAPFPGDADVVPAAPRNGQSRIHSGGVWVVAGGGRGITAVVARELAQRHGLKLQLLGTAPAPQLSDEIREAARRDRGALRRQIINDAGRDGGNGVERWRHLEKAIEIDLTLQACRAAGVTAAYHCCDLSDPAALRGVLQDIRRTQGPIRGVIQGAGIGQDARFDRKRPDKVAQCLGAKIDGCLNLMDLTRQDPLEWFVAFGSISGRFGANGHTDYSLANDWMAKLVDRYRTERPEVRSVTFHWHAWGDIGMATKPETRLALEMINLEFMPAKEGIAHFLNELERGGDEPEVLITDRAYRRKFFPIDRQGLEPRAAAGQVLPLLDPDHDRQLKAPPFTISLDPTRDRFLAQHLVQEKPTLPFVVALELLAEGARAASRSGVVLEARHVMAQQALKWSTTDPATLTIDVQRSEAGWRSRLLADVRRRDGQIVTRNREYFAGEFITGAELPARPRREWPNLSDLAWEPIVYLGPEATIYHGPDLQCLQRVAWNDERAWGVISASSTVQLGGGERPTSGWSVHCAAMDACLYAAAVFAWKRLGRPSLPVRFDAIRWGRAPDPGEPCLVEVQLDSHDDSGATLAFLLLGWNGDLLLEVEGYRIGWLG